MSIQELNRLGQPQTAYNWDAYIRSPFIGDSESVHLKARSSELPDDASQIIELPYKFMNNHFPGRDGSQHTIQLTFWDVEGLDLFKGFNRWREAIQSIEAGTQSPKIAIIGIIELVLLKNDQSESGVWRLINAFPENIGSTSLDYNTNDAITINATIRYDYSLRPLA